MPLDPWIARGVESPDVSNSLMQIGALKQRDQALAQDAEYNNALIADRQQGRADEERKAAEAQEMAMVYRRIKAGDQSALQYAIGKAGQNPEFAAFAQQNPEGAMQALIGSMEMQLGIKDEPERLPTSVEEYQRAQEDPGYAAFLRDGKRATPTQRVVVSGGGDAPAAPGVAAKPVPQKPIPTPALRIVDEAKQALTAASESRVIVNNAIRMLEGGKVKLGAVENIVSRGRNFAGASDENSRAYANIRQTLEKLRNNYLLLAKGVQTEGDAVRAWNSEIGENVQNDNALAMQQLKKAKEMTERAIEAQNSRIETVYGNFGQEPPAAGPANDLPDPAQHKGRRIRDTETGQVFISDGENWIQQ